MPNNHFEISISLSPKETSELSYLSECSSESEHDLVENKIKELLKEVYELTPDFEPNS